MFQPDHLDLLVHLLKGNREAIHDQLNKRAFDLEGFKDFITTHQLRGYVYSVLADSPTRKAFPQDLVDHLQSSYIRQRTKNEKMIRELKLLSSTFSRAGQEFILLKGPYLAKRFYGGIDRRVFWDIDILIRRKDLARAAQLLQQYGFKRTSRVLIHERLTTHFTHAFDFAKPGLTVDLHWALGTRPSYDIDYEDIWEQREKLLLNGESFSVLSDEYSLLFTIISIFRDIEVSKIRLRSFLDLHMILKTIHYHFDWDGFLEARKREHLFKISLNILSLFLRLFACHDEFPDLARALSHRESSLVSTDEKTFGKLITHSRLGLAQRMWAARLYEGSRSRLLLWWIVSLPFRRAAYRAGKLSRLKKSLNRLNRYLGLKG